MSLSQISPMWQKLVVGLALFICGALLADRNSIGRRIERQNEELIQLSRSADETKQRLAAFQGYPHSAEAFKSLVTEAISTSIAGRLASIEAKQQVVSEKLTSMQSEIGPVILRVKALEDARTVIESRLNQLEMGVVRINDAMAVQVQQARENHMQQMGVLQEMRAGQKQHTDTSMKLQNDMAKTMDRLLNLEVRVDDNLQPKRR